ncbi:MAG: cytochrome c1 [Woeseiaceae bacterium]|nr:cytochrome c1 [Woeseiaceae bacterium]
MVDDPDVEQAEETFRDQPRSIMPLEAAQRWFGQSPPDLSLIARSRGTDYLYNFLRGFYVDPDSPTGVDNLYLAGTSMPHVLWDLQGFQEATYEASERVGDGRMSRARTSPRFEQVTAGTLSPENFDAFVRDTVNFLEYISEPVRSTRRVLGVWVLMFLIFFYIVASMLKKQIWKDVS